MLPRRLYSFFQANQPIDITGIPRHVGLWVSSLWAQKTYRNSASSATGKKITIYCLHGTYDTHNAFSLVASRLIEKGLPEIINKIELISFYEYGQTIESFATELKNHILLNQDRDVILMGHSRGGLIAAYFAENLARENNINVHAVISICTPFKGSALARAPLTWVFQSVNEMQKSADFLQALSRQIIQSSTPYHYFSVGKDGIVEPEDCCVDGHQANLIQLDRHGHLSILSSGKLVDHIRNILAPIFTRFANETREEQISALTINSP